MKRAILFVWQASAIAAVVLVCLALGLRCLGVETVPVGRRQIELGERRARRGERFTAAMGLQAVMWGAGVMLAVYGASALYCAVEYDRVSWELFCQVWSRADAVHYRSLAELGYHGYIENGQHLFLVFFPLYPWTVRLLACVIPDYALCGHLVSALSYTAGCWVFARLVTEEFGWRTARLSLGLFSAYPFGFFFAAVYTESLFFLLSVTAFYCIRRHRYLLAGVTGALAALTRMQGAFLLLAGLAEYLVSERPLEKLRGRRWRALWGDVWKKLLPLALMGAGTAVYLWLNWDVEGDMFRFAYYQREHWYQYATPMHRCLATIWNELTDRAAPRLAGTVWLPDTAVFILCLGALVLGVRRLPTAWTVYFLVCVLVNYSISWPLSCGRYMACAFPLPVALAAAARRRPALARLGAAVFGIWQGAYLSVFLSGAPLY